MTATTGEQEIFIADYAPADEIGGRDVILPIQREEFGFAITADDPPDLAAIPEYY